MIDYSAGHIATDDAHAIVSELRKELTSDNVRLYPGVSYRHLLVYAGFPESLSTTPPHDITGKSVDSYLPDGDGAGLLNALCQKAHAVLEVSAVNKSLHSKGMATVTDIWLWGQGKSISLPTLAQRFGLTGSVISAVDLVRGLGVLSGLQIRIVPGATGYLGTNYKGKVQAATDALDEEDLVYLHVEAPDETGHEGDLAKKIQAIEEFDAHIVGPMLEYQAGRGDLRIIVTPDHPTPVAIRTHSAEPVPFALCGPGVAAGGYSAYSELAAHGVTPLTGVQLFEAFIRNKW